MTLERTIFFVTMFAFPFTLSENITTEIITTNSTTLHTAASIHWPSVIQHALFIVDGVAMIGCNGLLVATILIHSKLRQRSELIVVCSFALANALYGIYYFSAGIYRLLIVLGTVNLPLITSWTCMCQFFISFNILGPIAMSMAMTSLSIDRLIAVSSVGRYLSLGRVYLHFTVGLPYATALSFLASAFLLSYFDTRNVARLSPLCFLPWAIPTWFSILITIFEAIFATLSIIVYGVVVLVLVYKHGSIGSVAAHQARRQMRITKTVCIVTACTLILFVLPDLGLTAMEFQAFSPSFMLVAPFFYVPMGFSSVVSFIVYVAKQEEVRSHMLQMMRLKKVAKPTWVRPIGGS